MRRALIFCCLAAGCGLPDLDTPATRAGAAAPYPSLAPRSEILARVQPDVATAAIADLPARSAALDARARAVGAPLDREGILARAGGTKARAQGVRDVASAVDASAAENLRQRAAAIRANRDTASATPEPAEADADTAERLRRLRLLRDATGDDPL